MIRDNISSSSSDVSVSSAVFAAYVSSTQLQLQQQQREQAPPQQNYQAAANNIHEQAQFLVISAQPNAFLTQLPAFQTQAAAQEQQQQYVQIPQTTLHVHDFLLAQNNNNNNYAPTHNNNKNATNIAQLTSKCHNKIINANSYNPQCSGEPLPLSLKVSQDVVMEDNATSTSDANSNSHNDEEANADESCILPTDEEEAFTYLQGLNSDNLMHFSQQSAIQELMLKEQMDIKPNLDVLPTFEEHDIGGYKFKLNMRTQNKSRARYNYSEPLNKIYIRMNELFSVDVIYTPKMPLQALRVRAFICFVNEVSEPVVRCQNHMSKDDAQSIKLRQSMLRCENTTAEYCGTAEGKNITDRMSVLVPLNVCVPRENSIKQTLALKFTCQNSCVGRKETSLIFMLEGGNGEILSQRVLNFKVCSCPKRDKGLDERNLTTSNNKRPMNEDLYTHAAKLRKTESLSFSSLVKDVKLSINSDAEDPVSTNNSHEDLEKHFDLQRTPSGGYRLVVETTCKDVALYGIEAMMNKTAAKAVFDPNKSAHYSKNLRKLKRLYDRAQKVDRK